MKIRPPEVALAAVVVLAVAGGVGMVLSLDAGMKGDNGSAAPSATTGDPRAELNTAIPEAIRLIEAKDYAGLFQQFVPPGETAMNAQDYDRLIKNTPEAAQAMTKMLQVMRTLKNKSPQMDATGTKATYPLDYASTGRQQLVFVKINGRWYLQG